MLLLLKQIQYAWQAEFIIRMQICDMNTYYKVYLHTLIVSQYYELRYNRMIVIKIDLVSQPLQSRFNLAYKVG